MSTLISSSSTTQEGIGPATIDDTVHPDASTVFAEAKAPEPLLPNIVVLNTSTARNFTTARARVYVFQVYVSLHVLTI